MIAVIAICISVLAILCGTYSIMISIDNIRILKSVDLTKMAETQKETAVALEYCEWLQNTKLHKILNVIG